MTGAEPRQHNPLMLYLICQSCRRVVDATERPEGSLTCGDACEQARLAAGQPIVGVVPSDYQPEKKARFRMTEAAVTAIYRASGWTTEIAAQYGVQPELVEKIKLRKKYARVTKWVEDAATRKAGVRSAPR